MLERAAAGELRARSRWRRYPTRARSSRRRSVPAPAGARLLAGARCRAPGSVRPARARALPPWGPSPRWTPARASAASSWMARSRSPSWPGTRAAELRRGYQLALACEAFGAGERALEDRGRVRRSAPPVRPPDRRFPGGLPTARRGEAGNRDGARRHRPGGRPRRRGGRRRGGPGGVDRDHPHHRASGGTRAVEASIQVHGGIGFSWELGLHLGYRRVLAAQYLLGGEGPDAEAVGAAYMRRRSRR